MHRSIPARSFIGFGLLLGGCVCGRTADNSPAGVPPAVVFGRPAAANLERITIERVAWNDDEMLALAALPRRSEDVGRRVVIEERADTMLPPPWTTRLHILPPAGPCEGVRLSLNEHATYGVGHAWVNEKLLFIRVWWGRIAATDCILDVESLRLVYAEDAIFVGAIDPREVSGENGRGN
jgi:hypothetical protein